MNILYFTAYNKTLSKWRVYHLVQPYFFAHHHFHRRKIEVLRSVGISAWIISFVPETLYLENQDRYKEIISEGFLKVVRVKNENKINRAITLYFLRAAIFNKGIIIHILRTDPDPIIRLRHCNLIGGKIRYILEYEGDMPLEFIYQNAFTENPRPPVDPPFELKDQFENMLKIQKSNVQEADGLVFVTQEQKVLWEKRLGHSLNTCILPTLSNYNKLHFDLDKRAKTRQEFDLNEKLVLVYTGNVICKWQRFDSMAKFIAQLSNIIPNIWFLALVRLDDLELAREIINQYGLEFRSTLLNVSSNELQNYLSAADVALFLRHDHPMNKIVTSGKLGEYLATGLPIITTGANAKIINEFIQRLHVGVFIHDSLAINDKFIAELKALIERSQSTGWRVEYCKKTAEHFGGNNDPFTSYVEFISKIIANPGSKYPD